MEIKSILVAGGGIGGLTAAIALARKGYSVSIVERDPTWSVYGVGIIQQMNVIRAMNQLGVLDDYLSKSFGFDKTTLLVGPHGHKEAEFETPRLAGPQFPSNAGIRRKDLQKVLADAAEMSGVSIRLGLSIAELHDDGTAVDVVLTNESRERHDIVIGADGVFSATRNMIMPDAPTPRYTGQWVWRYNLPRPADIDGIVIYAGPCNAGLVPMSSDLMYLFLVSQEDADMKLPVEGSAAAMRERGHLAPESLKTWLDQITDDAGVVARPMEVVFLEGQDWHKGRVVLLGDAVHASTPHLAQGAGMAIEDGLVLADELSRANAPEDAFRAYRERRYPRVHHVSVNSERIGDAQMGRIAPIDVGALTGKTIAMMAEPV